MPPKRSAEAAPKRKEKAARPSPPADWRAPLFFWRGRVDGNTWEGTWVASTEGLPSDADFAASPNTFKLTCSDALPQVYRKGFVDGEPSNATFTGSYKLDNGDGLADYEDLEHEIWAQNGPPSHHPGGDEWAVVGARGNTEFGRFISLGRLDQRTDDGVPGDDTYTRLTLARRYIADNDKRAKMSAREVAGRVASCGPDEGFINAPWLAAPWRLPGNWPLPLMPKKELMTILNKHCEDEGTDWAVGVFGHSPFWKP